MEGKNNTSFSQFSWSEASQPVDFHFLENKEIEKFHSSKQLMKNFIQEIENESNFNLNAILSKYAKRQIEVADISKNVMIIIDKRIQKMIKSKRLKKNWGVQDTQLLFWTFSHYSNLNGINTVEGATEKDWQHISNLIPGSTSDSCMFKILSLKKIRLTSQKWTQLENALLLQIVRKKKYKNWRTIAQQLYKRSENIDKIFRNAKQCKQHWFCFLNPGVKKGSWSSQEDIELLKFVLQNNGGRRWAQISKKFGGRTQNALKNRYNLIIGQLKHQSVEQNQKKLIEEHLKKLLNKKEVKMSDQIKNQNESKKQSQTHLIFSKENIEIKQKQQISNNLLFIVAPINNSTFSQPISINYSQNYSHNCWNYQFFHLNGFCYQP